MEESRKSYISVQGVKKVFAGTVALDEIDFNLKQGEIHAIVGENGAGKSTLMKILSGAYSMTSGQVFIQDEQVELDGIDISQRYGIYMLYQELMNLPKLSVAENIFLGVLPRKSALGFVDYKNLYRMTKEYFDIYKISIDPRTQLSKLTIAEKQFVEIIRTITSKNAKVVIMDEPTSSLTKDETQKLFSIIRELKNKGIAVIYISHRLDEVIEIADRISVFRDGKNRGTLERDQFDEHKVIMLMLGRSLMRTEKESEKQSVQRTEVVFEVRNLNIQGRINSFNVKLFKGEILGIAGLMGSGKDELVKCLFGLWPATSKEIFYLGHGITIKTPKDAIKYGIVYLPEERKQASLFLELSVKYNITPIWLFNVHKKSFFNRKTESMLSSQFISQLNIKTSSSLEDIINLSGGNQQKAVFSRLIAANPSIMILNDPTRGVDVGSKEEIYKTIRKIVLEGGTSIIIVSSEIEEINYLANRVIVLSKGNICGEFSDKDVTLKNILTCAVRAKTNGKS